MADGRTMGTDDAAELRSALRDDAIVPYFQPLVELHTGHLSGFEVLARWLHPTRGIVHPDEFIGIAETAGLIGIVTDKLMHQACSAAVRWPEHLRLSVNLSPLQLHDRELPERLRLAAERTGFPLHRLVFETTSVARIRNLDLARTITGELKALGTGLALDDFGSDHAGLWHLQALPFDTIKVDAGFVRSMTYQPQSRKIVSAIIGLAHSLGLTTVAVGVENKMQTEMLACLGCEVVQGWLFGRPMPAEEVEILLAEVRPARFARNLTPRIVEDVALNLDALPSQCRAQLQALYDGAPMGLGFLDTKLRYIALNRRLAEMHATPVAAHLGRAVAEVLPDLAERIEAHLWRALGGQVVTDVEVLHGSPDDSTSQRPFRASYQPVRDASGEVVGISVTVIEAVEHLSVSPPPTRAIEEAEPALEGTKLTPRQADILQLLTEGRSVKEIARSLDLGAGTVKTHVSRIYATLGVRNRIEAVMRAERSDRNARHRDIGGSAAATVPESRMSRAPER